MGLLAAGSPRTGGGGIRMPTLMLGFLLVFAVVGYFGFERYRVQRESDDMFKRLEQTETDFRQQIATLEAENMELQGKVASHLKDLERYKQVTEEEARLDADRTDEIDKLKLQIKRTNQENQDLKERLKTLEAQLSKETGKNNSATQAEEEKKQGEDKDHGLAAEDKSESEAEEQVNSATQEEEEAAKSGELDDRKREQQPEQQQQQQQQQPDKSEIDDLDKVDEEDLDAVKAEAAKVDENADIVADE